MYLALIINSCLFVCANLAVLGGLWCGLLVVPWHVSAKTITDDNQCRVRSKLLLASGRLEQSWPLRSPKVLNVEPRRRRNGKKSNSGPRLPAMAPAYVVLPATSALMASVSFSGAGL